MKSAHTSANSESNDCAVVSVDELVSLACVELSSDELAEGRAVESGVKTIGTVVKSLDTRSAADDELLEFDDGSTAVEVAEGFEKLRRK